MKREKIVFFLNFCIYKCRVSRDQIGVKYFFDFLNVDVRMFTISVARYLFLLVAYQFARRYLALFPNFHIRANII